MPTTSLTWVLRIRNAADTADELVLSTGGTNPYIASPPDGDGAAVDVLTGETTFGVTAVQVIDGGATPVITAKLSDAEERQQYIGRKAILEETADGGATPDTITGYVNSIRLIDGNLWEFGIGDSRRVERVRRIFDRTTSRFDKVTQFIGPPIDRGWGLVREGPPHTYRVAAVTAGQVRLAVSGATFQTGFARWSLDRINEYVRSEFVPDGTTGRYPGIEVVVENLDRTEVGRFTPRAQEISINVLGLDFSLFVFLNPLNSSVLLEWAASQPNVDDVFIVRAYRTTIDEQNPLHIEQHPVDIWTELLDDAGVAYNSAAAATMKTTLGADTVCLYRVPGPASMQEWIEQHLYRPFGFSARLNDSGELELYSTRIRNSAVPVTTITENDVLDPGAPIFQVDEGTVVNVVTVTSKTFRLWQAAFGGERPIDDVIAVDKTRRFFLDSDADGNPDSDVYGVREQSLDIPGQVRINTALADTDDDYFEHAIAEELFDRFGRGGQYTTLALRRNFDVTLGEEAILDLPWFPSVTSRGSQRIVQVVRKTKKPGRIEIDCLDSGTSAQIGTVPTFTLAAHSDTLKRRVTASITNAATLNASEYRVEVEWATEGGATPGGGTLLTIFEPGLVPSSFDTPVVDSGSVVWVRMRSRSPMRRHSDWSDWESIDLTDLTAPSSLVATQDGTDPSKWVVTFTNNESDRPHEVFLYETGATPDSRLVQTLVPGSNRVTLYLESTGGATPAWDYIAGIRARDPVPHRGVSTTTEVTISGTGSQITLSAPQSPAIRLINVDDPDTPVRPDPDDNPITITMRLELSVLGTVLPSETVFELDSVGGATPVFDEVARIPTVAEARTKVVVVVPDDGSTWQLRAKHARDGANDSAYTSIVGLLPAFGTQKQPGPDIVDYDPSGKRQRAAAFDDAKYAPTADDVDGKTISLDVLQTDGVADRVIAKGRVSGQGQHGDAVTFGQTFQSPPMVLMRGGITHEPRNGQWSAGIDTALPQYEDRKAIDVSASGFTIRAQLRQKGTITAQSDDFPSGGARLITAIGTGNAVEANLDPSAAFDDQYTVHYLVNIVLDSVGVSGNARIDVSIDTNDGGGWVTRRTTSYSVGLNGTSSQTWSHEAITISVSGLGLNDDVRVWVSAEISTGGLSDGDWSFTVRCFNKAVDGDAESGVTYSSTGGDSVASMTPDAEDVVEWDAIAVS